MKNILLKYPFLLVSLGVLLAVWIIAVVFSPNGAIDESLIKNEINKETNTGGTIKVSSDESEEIEKALTSYYKTLKDSRANAIVLLDGIDCSEAKDVVADQNFGFITFRCKINDIQSLNASIEKIRYLMISEENREYFYDSLRKMHMDIGKEYVRFDVTAIKGNTFDSTFIAEKEQSNNIVISSKLELGSALSELSKGKNEIFQEGEFKVLLSIMKMNHSDIVVLGQTKDVIHLSAVSAKGFGIELGTFKDVDSDNIKIKYLGSTKIKDKKINVVLLQDEAKIEKIVGDGAELKRLLASDSILGKLFIDNTNGEAILVRSKR